MSCSEFQCQCITTVSFFSIFSLFHVDDDVEHVKLLTLLQYELSPQLLNQKQK